jgi:hypothetical protein
VSARKKLTGTRATPAAATAPPTLADAAVAEVLELDESARDGRSSVDPESRQEMIATTAYFIAEQRSFAPGLELADWLAAEVAVDATLRKIPANPASVP